MEVGGGGGGDASVKTKHKPFHCFKKDSLAGNIGKI